MNNIKYIDFLSKDHLRRNSRSYKKKLTNQAELDRWYHSSLRKTQNDAYPPLFNVKLDDNVEYYDEDNKKVTFEEFLDNFEKRDSLQVLLKLSHLFVHNHMACIVYKPLKIKFFKNIDNLIEKDVCIINSDSE